MIVDEIEFREVTAADMPGISHVRLSVTENAMSRAQLDARGITNESVAASFLENSKGWVAVVGDQIIGFSISDRESRSVFALFVLPEYERRGIGGRLFKLALQWLWDNSVRHIWLTTSPDTRAARMYESHGFIATGPAEHGDVRYELRWPAGS